MQRMHTNGLLIELRNARGASEFLFFPGPSPTVLVRNRRGIKKDYADVSQHLHKVNLKNLIL